MLRQSLQTGPMPLDQALAGSVIRLPAGTLVRESQKIHTLPDVTLAIVNSGPRLPGGPWVPVILPTREVFFVLGNTEVDPISPQQVWFWLAAQLTPDLLAEILAKQPNSTS